MAYVMLGSTTISLIAGGLWDSLALGGMLLINAVIGAFQSDKADSAIASLHQLTAKNTTVVRDGTSRQISTDLIVPGDIILLEPGDSIPADGWLVSHNEVLVDESLLTGESIGVPKLSQSKVKAQLSAGTSLLKGKAKLLVARTGPQTRMGQIALMMREDADGPTPLQLDLDNLAKTLLKGLVAVCGAVVGLGVLRGQGLGQMALTSASMAAATIPQGMTAFVTLGLVAGVRELAKRKTVVRKLSALESLATVNCLCLDKTGTITHNQMTVASLYTDRLLPVDEHQENLGNDDNVTELLIAGSVCNDAELRRKGDGFEVVGDGTDGAFLLLAEEVGLSTHKLKAEYECVNEASFTSERERMSILVNHKGTPKLYVKGSPESILPLCNLENQKQDLIKTQVKDMASQGLRVLALATRQLFTLGDKDVEKLENNLVFLGLAGLWDPPRHEAKELIALCQQAGIKVVMITGDHPETAVSISTRVGLNSSQATTMTGKELANLSESDMKRRLPEISVFARVLPEQKRSIIQSLKNVGYVVAMVGDGVNDGPALKAADVGVSMGAKGADVAQEASDMILATDDLQQIVTAITHGRLAYDNISKVISYLLTSNAGEISLMLSAAASGMSMPLLPIQLLWVNLLGDGPPALALCVEQSDGQEFSRPPRPKNGTLLTETVKRRILFKGARMGLVTLALYGLSIWQGAPVATARTRALAALGVEQVIHLFESRIVQPGVPVPENPAAKKTALFSLGMLAASVYLPPLQRIFHLVPLALIEWLAILGFALVATPPMLPAKPRSNSVNHGKLPALSTT